MRVRVCMSVMCVVTCNVFVTVCVFVRRACVRALATGAPTRRSCGVYTVRIEPVWV